jgi:hypothetical protein
MVRTILIIFSIKRLEKITSTKDKSILTIYLRKKRKHKKNLSRKGKKKMKKGKENKKTLG